MKKGSASEPEKMSMEKLHLDNRISSKALNACKKNNIETVTELLIFFNITNKELLKVKLGKTVDELKLLCVQLLLKEKQ